MASISLDLLQKYSVPGPRYTSYPAAPYFHPGFGKADWRPLAAEGLVEIASDRVKVTASGRLFLRNIGMCFDRTLKEAASVQSRYSRTA